MSALNDAELYFTWWCNELQEKGLAKEWAFEPKEFDIFPSDILTFKRFMKRGDDQINTKVLFKPLTWKPDFSVTLHRSLEGKMFAIIDDTTDDNYIITPDNFDKSKGNIYQETFLFTTTSEIIDENWVRVWFDVKPPTHAFQKNALLASGRDFRYLQRIMFYENKVYVNKVVTQYGKESKTNKVDTLFVKSFLPKRYKFTDKSKSLRKLKSHEAACRSLENYLEQKEWKV